MSGPSARICQEHDTSPRLKHPYNPTRRGWRGYACSGVCVASRVRVRCRIVSRAAYAKTESWRITRMQLSCLIVSCRAAAVCQEHWVLQACLQVHFGNTFMTVASVDASTGQRRFTGGKNLKACNMQMQMSGESMVVQNADATSDSFSKSIH
jgi:hypothetical protein